MHRFRSGLRFNPIGIGTLGLVHAALHSKAKRDVRLLLAIAARGDPAAAHGFSPASDAMVELNPRLPTAVLRCAFSGAVRPRIRHHDPQPEDDARKAQAVAHAKRAVDAELAWLRDEADEPAWPVFPETTARARERLNATTSKRPVQTSYVDHQAAGIWVSHFTSGDGRCSEWMPHVVDMYSAWTAEANGSKLDRRGRVSDPPRNWNHIYWRLVARCVAQWDDQTLKRLCLLPLLSLADEAFLDAMSDFLRSLDFLYLTSKGPTMERVAAIRAALAGHLRTTGQFKRISYDHFIEHHTFEALQALFFTNASFRRRPECYVPTADGRKLLPFMPVLESLATERASLGAAIVATALLDSVAFPEFVSFGVALANAWVAHFPDDAVFWVDNGVGKRWCDWLSRVYSASPTILTTDTTLRRDVDRILSDLVRVGVPEASQFETALRA